MNWKHCALSATLVFVSAPAFAQNVVHANDFEGRRPAWQTHGLWDIDETPASAPGGHAYSGTKSLNFNNGTNYAGVSRGNSASPVISVAPGSSLTVAFRCNYQTETTGSRWDQRLVLLKIDSAVVQEHVLAGGRTTPAPIRCAAMGTWHRHELPLRVPSSSQGNVQVEFAFNSIDDYANDFAGWFVDDFEVVLNSSAAQAFNVVSRTTQDFRQYAATIVVRADKSVELRQSSPTARYALITGTATDAEFQALTQAIQAGRIASIPASIPDNNVYIVAPTTFSLVVDSAVGANHNTIGGSLGVYDQWAPQLLPVMSALQAIQARLLAGPTPTGDDHGDTAQAATALSFSLTAPPTPGSIESAGDVDFFRVADVSPMIAIFPPPQRLYVFETTVVGNMDTVIDLYAADGTTLLATNDDGGAGLASRIAHSAPQGTVLYAKVRHYSSNGTGDYTIRTSSNLAPTPPIGPVDDHGNSTQDATSVNVGDPATAGSIDPAGDVDVFEFSQIVIAIFPPPQANFLIQTSVIGGMDTVIELYASDGTTLLASNDDAPGLGYASRVEYTGNAAGPYYVKVRHYSSSGTGDYTLSVTTTP